MNSTHITGDTTVSLGEPSADHQYLALGLRGSSLSGAVVRVEYSPDGTSWSVVEGLTSDDATSPIALGSFRTIRVPAMLRLSVTGSTGGTDFYADHVVSQW